MRDSTGLTIDEITRYWLLTSAIEFSRGLAYFLPKVHELGLNMKEIPGCAPEGYAATLLDLFDAGELEFSSALEDDDVTSRAGVSNILDRFLGYSRVHPEDRLIRAISEIPSFGPNRVPQNLKVKFKLTELGGEAWERVAEPDWFHFFGQSNDNETGELYSQDLTLLMARLGWFDELASARVAIDTIQLQMHSDYQVLYWKRLPSVYRATFSVSDCDSRWVPTNFEPRWFREWWHSTTRWHKQPWNLPGWPNEPPRK
jgi:hypothetical protein